MCFARYNMVSTIFLEWPKQDQRIQVLAQVWNVRFATEPFRLQNRYLVDIRCVSSAARWYNHCSRQYNVQSAVAARVLLAATSKTPNKLCITSEWATKRSQHSGPFWFEEICSLVWCRLSGMFGIRITCGSRCTLVRRLFGKFLDVREWEGLSTWGLVCGVA